MTVHAPKAFTQPVDQSGMAELLDVLAALYLHEPTYELVRDYNKHVVPFVEQHVSELLKPVDASKVEELKEDYHALFLVPVSGRYLSPFESAQRNHRLWGPITHEVALIYTQTGFDINTLAIDETWQAIAMPDHIGFELAFTSLLLRQVSSAEKALKQTYAYFIQHHVLSWMPEYGNQLQTLANTRFYKDLGRMTAFFVRTLQTE